MSSYFYLGIEKPYVCSLVSWMRWQIFNQCVSLVISCPGLPLPNLSLLFYWYNILFNLYVHVDLISFFPQFKWRWHPTFLGLAFVNLLIRGYFIDERLWTFMEQPWLFADLFTAQLHMSALNFKVLKWIEVPLKGYRVVTLCIAWA